MKIVDKWMKWPLAGKIASVLVVLAIIGGIAGSGGGNDAPEPADQAPAAEQVSEPAQEQEEPQGPEGTLTAHFIDVGQGDSEFLELPDGRTMLIDAGESSEGSTVVGYIRSLGYSDIDYVVATHPHSDHIGGMPAVFGAFEVGEVWAPAVTHDTQAFEAFLDAVDAEGLSINAATAGKTVYDASGCTVDVISPTDGASYDDLNDWSAILEVEFGDETMLFTGDAGSGIISSAKPGDVDVLKVGHHGSDTSTTASLVSSLSPEYAVISCGAGNSYGHPHQSTLEALSSATVYRTDVDGTVVATTDGSSIEWRTGATAPRENAQAQAEAEAAAAAAAAATASQAQNQDDGGSSGVTVYITKSGEKYHLDGCSSLRKSKIPVSLEDAKARGYEPCKNCNPPA